jgi:hypothetical protein
VPLLKKVPDVPNFRHAEWVVPRPTYVRFTEVIDGFSHQRILVSS